MRFKPRQQVVCIEKGDWTNTRPDLGKGGAMPQYNEIVTVERYCFMNNDFIMLVEYNYYGAFGGRICFDESSFEPLITSEELESELAKIEEPQTA